MTRPVGLTTRPCPHFRLQFAQVLHPACQALCSVPRVTATATLLQLARPRDGRLRKGAAPLRLRPARLGQDLGQLLRSAGGAAGLRACTSANGRRAPRRSVTGSALRRRDLWREAAAGPSRQGACGVGIQRRGWSSLCEFGSAVSYRVSLHNQDRIWTNQPYLVSGRIKTE